nr:MULTISPECIES: DUF6497 family protein [Pseudohalocynthiibacter]
MVSAAAALFVLNFEETTNPAQIPAPSGQPITFYEIIWGQRGPSGMAVRFRFLAPEIAREGGRIEFAQAEEDMKFLCESYALPRIAENGPKPTQIIISLSDRIVEFGSADPAATQFFEAYRPEDTTCIWEGF